MEEMGKHDVVFGVLYGANRFMMVQTITAMANRLFAMTSSTPLQEMVEELLAEWQTICITRMQAVWVLLFNVDLPMKEYIMSPGNANVFKKTMGLDPAQECTQHPMRAMMRCQPLSPGKARRFITDLHAECIPNWIQNEMMGPLHLVTASRDIYLNA
jgi:hypothetical protein